MPSLSIVIPVYRQLRCLDLTLRSLAAQTPSPAELEIIIVDDDSEDDTASVVAKHQGLLPIRLIRQRVNRGRAAARNVGAASASADRLLLIDADSYADPGLLVAHARFGQSWPAQVLLGARVESTWLPSGGQLAPPASAASGYSRDIRFKLGLDPATFPASAVPWIFAYSHNISLPTADFRACGGFDENFTGWGYEDVEFAYRLYTTAGRPPGYFQFDPLAVCYHLPHFRQSRDNWMQADRMLPYLTAKHRSLEFEFIDEGPLVVCDLLPVYLSRLALLHGAGRADSRRALATLSPAAQPGRLVIGIGLAQCLPPDELTEVISHRPPDQQATPSLIGLRLPYPDDRFADVAHLDLWRILSPDHLSQLVSEGLRVARVVYLGYSRQLPDAAGAGMPSDPDFVCDMLSAYCQASINEAGPGFLWITAKRR